MRVHICVLVCTLYTCICCAIASGNSRSDYSELAGSEETTCGRVCEVRNYRPHLFFRIAYAHLGRIDLYSVLGFLRSSILGYLGVKLDILAILVALVLCVCCYGTVRASETSVRC